MIRPRVLLVLALAVGLVAAAATPGLAGHDFDDVPDDHPFHDEISWLVDEEITDGYGDGTFRPTTAVSRQAAAAFLFRLAGEPEGDWQSSFDDVDENHQFYTEISWAVQAGITSGFEEDNTFRPTRAVSRQASAAFLYRFAGEPEGEWASNFDDVDENHQFYTEISWVAEQGITNGYAEDNTYRPTVAVSRQAAAAFLFRADEQLGSIAGEVREPGFLEIDGAPIEDASVWIEQTTHETTTDAEGAYLLAHVPPGEYTLHADADGYEPDSRTVVVEPGQDVTGENFVLQPTEEPESDVAINDPTTEQPATAPVGTEFDITFETTRAGDYVLDLRADGAEGDWLAFDDADATGTVDAGEHTVTVTVPETAANDEAYDLRATFTPTGADPVEDIQARSLFTSDGIVVNVTQDTSYPDLASADTAANADDELHVHGTVAVAGLTELTTAGLTVDGLGSGVLDLGDAAEDGIFLDGDGQTLTRLRFENYQQRAVRSDERGGSDPVVSDNVFAGERSGTAVSLEAANGGTVTGNLFLDHEVGLVTADTDADISANEFHLNDLGVQLTAEGLEATVVDNTFTPFNAAYLCDGQGTHDLTSSGDLATANEFEDHPPVAFDDCLLPAIAEPYVHNLDSFEGFQGETAIQQAVDAASGADTFSDGDTLVAHGSFAGQVTIGLDGITLSGEDAALTASGLADGQDIVTITGDDVVLEGLEVVDAEPATTTVAVQVEGAGVTVTGTTLSRPGTADDQAAHPLLRVLGQEAVINGNTLVGGPLTMPGQDGAGILLGEVSGNSVSDTTDEGIVIDVADSGALPLVGDQSDLVVENNAVTNVDRDGSGSPNPDAELHLTQVPDVLNGEEPEDAPDARRILWRDNPDIDTVEVPTGEWRDRNER